VIYVTKAANDSIPDTSPQPTNQQPYNATYVREPKTLDPTGLLTLDAELFSQ
jgi:hypothetical protein